MRFFILIPFISLAALLPTISHAQVNWEDACKEERVYDPNTGTYTWKGTRGKYFCIQEEPETPEELPPEQQQKSAQKPEEEVDCEDPEQWSSQCGFVNPDTLPPEEAFAFQSRQRDTLLQNMAVRPNSMDSVVNAQKYMNWVINKAMLLSEMYNYSAVQNPDLDPNTMHSSASFAQKLIAARDLDNKKMFWTALKSWESELVLFTRASCDFCEEQGRTMRNFVLESEIPLVEVALEECVISYASECITGETAQLTAQKFNVETVPTTMVFVPDKGGDTPADGLWMRVSNGFSSGATIRNRLYTYLNAWYSAAAKGVDDAMKSPDFLNTQSMSRQDMYEQLNGVIGEQDDKEGE